MPNPKKHDPPARATKIKLGDVGKYLGVSWRVVERLVKEGTIKPARDPLDHRRKLVSTEQLDRLKRDSLKDD
jgi:DNA-binding MarR family transcriptional regulator